MKVITYQLAYLSNRSVSLCAACVERGSDQHRCGTLGPVQHGEHHGECESPTHGKALPTLTYEIYEVGSKWAPIEARDLDHACKLAEVSARKAAARGDYGCDRDRVTRISYRVVGPDGTRNVELTIE